VYFPYEIFENIGPIGSAPSVEAAQSGIDRSDVLQESSDPNYVRMIKNWKSVTSNQSTGFGERKISTISQAVGIALEYHLLRRDILGYDEQSGTLVQKRHKQDYEVVPAYDLTTLLGCTNGFTKEDHEKIKLDVTGNRMDGIMVCPNCGSSDYLVHEAGCNGITCKAPGCGYSDCS